MESIETVIVGAGSAGLSTSYYLTRQGREHSCWNRPHGRQCLARRALGLFTLVTPTGL